MPQKKKISDEDFVRACLLHGSAEAISQALGIARMTIYIRAERLRKRGVNIPKLGARVDVDGLNKLIETMSNGKHKE